MKKYYFLNYGYLEFGNINSLDVFVTPVQELFDIILKLYLII